MNGTLASRTAVAQAARRIIAGLALGVVALAAMPTSTSQAFSFPASIYVPCAGPGGGTPGLISALNTANAASSATVTLEPDCTYTLTSLQTNGDGSGLPAIRKPITINGPATITRSSTSPLFRIFTVETIGRLTLKNVTVSGGADFGVAGIFNQGSLALYSSTVSNNVTHGSGLAGGIGNATGAVASVNSSLITGNFGTHGGGIRNEGSLTVNSSTISNNQVGGDSGGGITSLAGVATINSSIITGNSVPAAGGGVFVEQGSRMTVNSSDISNNRASNGGGASANGELHINSSTVHDNTATTTGGGVFRYLGTITLPGTDVTANTPNNCAAFTGTPDC